MGAVGATDRDEPQGVTAEKWTPGPCVEACWTPVPCPTCGDDLLPHGRSAPLGTWEGPCCEQARRSDVNKRHLWSADDDERWRFHPKPSGEGVVTP